MPCCCVRGCHNRWEKGHKLYKLPQGPNNEARRKLWIQNIGRTNPLPLHAYVCQDHFTDDQFELGRADHRRLLKWNSVPTIFPRCKAQNIKCRRPPKREVIVLAKDESSMNSPEKATMDENLNTEIRIRRTEVNEESCNDDIMEENLNTELGLREIEVNKERCKDSTDEVVALKCKLNASLKEIHTLRTIIFQLQEIIKRLVEEKHVDET